MACPVSPRPEHHLSLKATRITYIDLGTPKPYDTPLPRGTLSGPTSPEGIPVSPASSENSGAQAHEALSPAFCYQPVESKRTSAAAMDTPLSASATPRPSHMETDAETEAIRRQDWERQMAVEQSEKTQALAAREQAVSEREASVAERERLLLVQMAALQDLESKVSKQDEAACAQATAQSVSDMQTATEEPAADPLADKLRALSTFQSRVNVEPLLKALNKTADAQKRLQQFLGDPTAMSEIADTVLCALTRPTKEPKLQEQLAEAQQRFAAVQAVRCSRLGPGHARDQQLQAALDGLEDVLRFLAEAYTASTSTQDGQQQTTAVAQPSESISARLQACRLRVNALRVAGRATMENFERSIGLADEVSRVVEAADEDAAALRSKLLRFLNVVYREYAPLCNSYMRMKEVVMQRNERRVSHLRKLVEGMVEVDPSAGPINEDLQSTVSVLEDQQKHLRKYFEQKARVSGFVEKLLEDTRGRAREEDSDEIEQLAKRPRPCEPEKEKPSLIGRVVKFMWS